ncbi:MAG: alpha/beta hydrolase, partial [Pseudomonadales bacterium]|nr:alpha/beta hydrolase [Pseudomonadales bacterium]
MPTIQLSTGLVHYADYGQGVPMVFLHANPGDSRDFEAVIPALSSKYRLLVLDWPGYGQSAMPDSPQNIGVTFFYQVLREFLTKLKLPPAIFVGNSLGGNVAARLASESPQLVRGLVLVSAGGFTPHNVITRSFCKFQGSPFAMSPYWWARLYLHKRTPVTQAMLERAATLQAEPERVALNRAIWRSFIEPEHDLRQVAKKINVPTLLIFGKKDPAIPPNKDG